MGGGSILFKRNTKYMNMSISFIKLYLTKTLNLMYKQTCELADY